MAISMRNPLLMAAVGTSALALSLGFSAAWNGQQAAESQTFATASVRFEQNATDGDVEVVFEITGRDDGLTKLTIVAPNGRTIADFTAPDRATLGLRQFILESPEPRDVAALKAAYPEGTYTFRGLTARGQAMAGSATLTHRLPATTAFVRPQADAKDVNPSNLQIEWAPSADAVGYIIELEQEGSDLSLTAKLPKTTTRFAPPDNFIQPGHEYTLGIGTVAGDGNISFVETSFATTAK
jgi:hypothetical protein